MIGWVYLASGWSPDGPLCKVGRSDTPDARMAALRGPAGERVRLSRAWRVWQPSRAEAEALGSLLEWRIDGAMRREWFRMEAVDAEPRIVAALQAANLLWTRQRALKHAWGMWRGEGLPLAEISRLTDLPASTLSRKAREWMAAE